MAKDLKSQIKKEATDHLRNADRIFKLGDYPAALAEVDQALALDPQNYYALAFRKRILEVYTPGQASSAPSPASAPTEVAPPPAPSPTSPVVEADIAQATRQKRAPQRKLAAIMFTDMVGYSAVTQKNESLAIELLDRHRRILRPIFPEFEGQEIKTIGDAFLVEFPSVLQAVQCGMAIQRAMGDYNAASDSTYKMELRVGIHLGDVIYQEDDIIGDGVNIAARIHEQAEPGGICVSQDVYNQIRNREGFHFEDKGEVMLKNILLPVHVYKITTTEEAYRKIEEKTLEEAREEGIRKARVDFLQKSIDKATELLSSESTDAALAELMKVYALDPDNADAKALEESIRTGDTASERTSARNISRDLPQYSQTNLDRWRPFTNGALVDRNYPRIVPHFRFGTRIGRTRRAKRSLCGNSEEYDQERREDSRTGRKFGEIALRTFHYSRRAATNRRSDENPCTPRSKSGYTCSCGFTRR